MRTQETRTEEWRAQKKRVWERRVRERGASMPSVEEAMVQGVGV